MTKLQPRAQASPHLQEIHERERIYLERARTGEDIRDEAILSLQPIVERMAYRLYSRLSPQSNSLKAIEQEDLVQEANVRMLDQFPKALDQDDPFRWLTGVAFGGMRDCLNGRGDTIKRLHSREKPIPMLRLDRPLTEDGFTLADILPNDFRPVGHMSEHLLAAIEQAIEVLPEKQRMLIERYFGFHGKPVSLTQICRDLYPLRRGHPSSTYLYQRALASLHQKLSQELPQYATAGGAR